MSIKNIPLTFYLNFSCYHESMRKFLLHEFAGCGEKHLVLNDTIIAQAAGNSNWLDNLQKELNAEGLSFVDAHAPFGPEWDMNCPWPEQRKFLVNRNKFAINLAASVNVNTITIHLGNDFVFPEIPLSRHIDLACEMLDNILPEAEKCGVTVCIENIWSPNNTPEVLLQIKEKFPSDALGFCFDAGHANIMNNGRHYSGGTARERWNCVGLSEVQWDDRILEKMLPHVTNCHLHDNYGDRDAHDLPGCGNIDWPHIIKLLAQAPKLKSIQTESMILGKNQSIRELVEKTRQILY